MRTDIEALEHACNMVHSHVNSFQALLAVHFPHLDTIGACAASGRYLHPDTNEARNMLQDAATLRQIAALIEASRAKLVANMPAQLIAAE